MGVESLIKLKSQESFAERLAATLVEDEAFALLSGDSGSGRTTMCEQVVNLVDGKCLAVFIPCRKEMSLEQLRELFLQQLLPGQDWELGNTLGDTLMTLHIPTPQKILMVADDLDEVISSFYDELLQIASDFQGQNRFSFLVTGHPLWAQGRLQTQSGKLAPSEWPMPGLTMEEAMQLCKAKFNSQGLLPVYKEINGKLPYKLEQCQGNIGKILKLTEILMAKPDQVNEQNAEIPEDINLGAVPPKKKRSMVVIFITVICLVIALACMVPLFLGGNFFKGLFGGGTNEPAVTQVSDGRQQGVDPFAQRDGGPDEGSSDEFLDEGEEGMADEDGAEPQQAASGKGKAKARDQQQNAQGSETSTLDSILADGPHGDEQEAVADEGDLLPDVQGGLEAENTAPPKKSVTLSGETLEQIEKQGADSQDSDRPRRGVGGSVEHKQDKKAPAKSKADKAGKAAKADKAEQAAEPAKNEQAKPAVLTRADNALRMEEKRKQAEADEKAREEEARAATARREAEEIARAEERIKQEQAQKEREQASVVSLPSPASKSSAKPKPQAQPKLAAPAETKPAAPARSTARQESSPSTIYARNVSSSGSAVPGSVQDLAALPRSHYTLQVVASRDRAAVTEVASALSGKYWIYETVREGKPWFVLITGDYASAREAMRGVNTLPRSLRGAGPFAKSFGTVRSEIAAQ
ncbi:MAG: AAA family ATPase [Succinivibrio sp.]|nr:AAA family ATPase [Succinivibrio sp.]